MIRVRFEDGEPIQVKEKEKGPNIVQMPQEIFDRYQGVKRAMFNVRAEIAPYEKLADKRTYSKRKPNPTSKRKG